MTKKINCKQEIKQSNKITTGRYSMSLMEQRILYVICSQMPKNTDDFVPVRVSVSDLADVIGIESTNKYTVIRRLSNNLMRRLVTIPTADGGEYTSHWIQSRRFYPNDSSVEFQLDSSLKNEFLKLRQAYVHAPMGILTSFSYLYTARIYLILIKWAKVKDFQLTLDFFRKTFELGPTYNSFSHIKMRIFEPCLKEINEKTEMQVTWQYLKTGRRYTTIQFHVVLSNQGKKEQNKSTETKKEISSGEMSEYQKLVSDLNDDERRLLLRMVSIGGIDPKVAHDRIKKYGYRQCYDNFETKRRDTHVKNMAGAVLAAIDNDYVGTRQRYAAEARAEGERKQQERREASRVHKQILEKMEEAYAQENDIEAEEEKQETTVSPKKTLVPFFILEAVKKNGQATSGGYLVTLKQSGWTVGEILDGTYDAWVKNNL